jgi:hypothetical protein
MAQNILAQNFYFIDGTNSTESLDFRFNDRGQLLIPLEAWFETGRLDLRWTVQFFLSFGNIPPDRRFLNPTRYTAGHVAILTNDFVVTDFELKYEKQLYNYDFPTINIGNSNGVFPITLQRTSRSEPSHGFTTAPIPICGISTNVPPPTPNYTSATIPLGSICMRIGHGADEFDQIDRRDIAGKSDLILDLRGYFHALSLSGIVRAGVRLDAVTTFYNLSEQSGVQSTPGNTIVEGSAPFPVYDYTCDLGMSVPALTNTPCVGESVKYVTNPTTGLLEIQWGAG